MQTIKRNILIVNNNMKVRWEQQFPSVYGKKEFNGNNERNISLAIKELQLFSLTEVRKVAKKLGLMYYISQNEHNNKWGLDKQQTPEGGGVIAQDDNYIECIKKAKNEYGIHPIFIYGVGVDGF